MLESKFSIAFPAVIGVIGTLLGVGGGIYSTTLSSSMEVDRQRIANCISRFDRREEIVRDRAEKLLVALSAIDPKMIGRNTFRQSETAKYAEKVATAAFALAPYVEVDLAFIVTGIGSALQSVHMTSSQKEADEAVKSLQENSIKFYPAFKSELKHFDKQRENCKN